MLIRVVQIRSNVESRLGPYGRPSTQRCSEIAAGAKGEACQRGQILAVRESSRVRPRHLRASTLGDIIGAVSTLCIGPPPQRPAGSVPAAIMPSSPCPRAHPPAALLVDGPCRRPRPACPNKLVAMRRRRRTPVQARKPRRSSFKSCAPRGQAHVWSGFVLPVLCARKISSARFSFVFHSCVLRGVPAPCACRTAHRSPVLQIIRPSTDRADIQIYTSPARHQWRIPAPGSCSACVSLCGARISAVICFPRCEKPPSEAYRGRGRPIRPLFHA